MAFFGFDLEKCKPVEDYLAKFNKTMEDSNLVRNPFNGEALLLDNSFIVSISPVYFNYPFIGGFFIGLASFLLNGFSFTWGYVVAMVFFLFSLLWSSLFYSFVCRMGLRKNGYKGKLKRLSNNDIVRRLLNGTRRSIKLSDRKEGA